MEQESHNHKFKVKFFDDPEEFIVDCHQSSTVLQAIKTLVKYEEKIGCPDEMVRIEREGDNEHSIPIQSRCSLIGENEVLIVTTYCEPHTYKEIQPDRRIKIYISNEGWENTKTKMFLKNKALKTYLPVYGEKGITVEEALKRDGRFIDDLSNFKLFENKENSIECTEKIDNLDNKKFKIFLPEKQRTADPSQTSLIKENFGNFTEVHSIVKLLKLGKSVCQVSVKGVCVGTGFVLCDTFILTSAHLFKDYVKGKELQDVEVLATFDYENPKREDTKKEFRAEHMTDFDADLDYAVLELNPEGSKPNKQTTSKSIKVPPGLLKKFGELPVNGEACIIGHPAEGVKKMDLTSIIETDERGQAADEKLRCLFKINSNRDYFRKQGTENKLEVGNKAGKVATDHTFKYHGASGSLLFNSFGKVFGLHIGRKTDGFTEEAEGVIEYGCPLIIIFEKLVNNLKKSGNEELLKSIEMEAKGNNFLTKVLNTE